MTKQELETKDRIDLVRVTTVRKIVQLLDGEGCSAGFMAKHLGMSVEEFHGAGGPILANLIHWAYENGFAQKYAGEMFR